MASCRVIVRACQNVLTEQALPSAVLGRLAGCVRTTAVLRCRSNAVRLTRSKMAHQGLWTSHAQGICCCIPVCRGGGLYWGLLGGFTTACWGAILRPLRLFSGAFGGQESSYSIWPTAVPTVILKVPCLNSGQSVT